MTGRSLNRQPQGSLIKPALLFVALARIAPTAAGCRFIKNRGSGCRFP